MIIMRGDENPQRPLESDPGSPRRSTGNGKFREFLEGGGKFGGDWKRVLCAGMGARTGGNFRGVDSRKPVRVAITSAGFDQGGLAAQPVLGIEGNAKGV